MALDLSKIFIISPDDMLRQIPPENATYPNFVMQGEKSSKAGIELVSSSSAIGTMVSAISAGVPLISLPLGLILGAGLSSPAIIARIMKEKPETTNPLAEQEKKALESFIIKHGVTLNMVRETGFHFPPGHPQVGEVYKRHPLADLPSAGKENVYIPQDKYDEILMAERESELIKLLVHLGATKISITKNKEANRSATSSGTVSAGGPAGSVGIEASAVEKLANINSDKREFLLSGKHWKPDDTVDRTSFAWLNYEPSWEALVVAREVGGCTKAAIDIRENTTSSTDKALAAKVESAFYSGKISGGIVRSRNDDNVFTIESEFSDVQPASPKRDDVLSQ